MNKELPSYVSQSERADDPIGVRLECLKQACMLANSIGDVDSVIQYADKMLKFVVEAKVPSLP